MRPEYDFIIQQFTVTVKKCILSHHIIFTSMNFKFATLVKFSPLSRVSITVHSV